MGGGPVLYGPAPPPIGDLLIKAKNADAYKALKKYLCAHQIVCEAPQWNVLVVSRITHANLDKMQELGGAITRTYGWPYEDGPEKSSAITRPPFHHRVIFAMAGAH